MEGPEIGQGVVQPSPKRASHDDGLLGASPAPDGRQALHEVGGILVMRHVLDCLQKRHESVEILVMRHVLDFSQNRHCSMGMPLRLFRSIREFELSCPCCGSAHEGS